MKTALRALMLAFVVIVMSSAYAHAQTPPAASPAPAATIGAPSTGTATTGAKRHGPCADDVQNFCSTVQKGGGRVLACLKQNEGKLSTRCEAAMKRHAAKDAAGAPAAGATTTGK